MPIRLSVPIQCQAVNCTNQIFYVNNSKPRKKDRICLSCRIQPVCEWRCVCCNDIMSNSKYYRYSKRCHECSMGNCTKTKCKKNQQTTLVDNMLVMTSLNHIGG